MNQWCWAHWYQLMCLFPSQVVFVIFTFFAALMATECFFLTAMSYDCYIGICNPLHYSSIMDHGDWLQLASASWVAGFLAPTLLMILIFWLPFCGASEIDHSFCDLKPILKLALISSRWDDLFICLHPLPANSGFLHSHCHHHSEDSFYHGEAKGLLHQILPSDNGQSVLWDAGHCLWLSTRASVWRH